MITNPGSMISTVKKYGPYIKLAGLDKKFLGASIDDIMPFLDQIQNNPEAMAMLGQQIGASFTGILKGVVDRIGGKAPPALALPGGQAPPPGSGQPMPSFVGGGGTRLDPTKAYDPATMRNV